MTPPAATPLVLSRDCSWSSRSSSRELRLPGPGSQLGAPMSPSAREAAEEAAAKRAALRPKGEAPDPWEVVGIQACDSPARRMLPGMSADSLPGSPQFVSKFLSRSGGAGNNFVVPSCEQMRYDFEIRIMMGDGNSLGLEISSHDGTSMLIGKVKDGAIADWNAQCSGMHSVRRGDRIMEVNGAKGDVNCIFGALRQQGELTIRISRLLEFHFMATKVEDRLGIEFDSNRADELNVMAVHEGASRDVCRRCGPELELRHGDRILEINGQSGDSMTLLAVIKSTSTLDFLVRRP